MQPQINTDIQAHSRSSVFIRGCSSPRSPLLFQRRRGYHGGVSEVRARLLVVPAGGPHTRSRIERALGLGPSGRPDFIVLTGREFNAEERDCVTLVANAFRSVPIRVHEASTTVESCQRLAAELRGAPEWPEIIVVTSNYHAPRLRWLLKPLLPPRTTLRIETCPDVRWRDLLRVRLARRLIRGEVLSWLYCLPLGLLWRAVVRVPYRASRKDRRA